MNTRRNYRLIVILCWGAALCGCSLMDPKSRPDPDAENVACVLEYQPAPGTDADDLLFLAMSSPYDEEQFNLSLPDVLIHKMFAPGRHLDKDARVEGATCSTRPWQKGFRLPTSAAGGKWMLCRRMGLEPVLFEVETKWGVCTRQIPEGDASPRAISQRGVVDLPELAGLD